MTTLMILLSLLAPSEPPRYDTDTLARALELRLTYPSSLRAGRAVHVWHCRKAPQGCVERVRAFAQMFVEAGRKSGVSPWLLSAMAMRESGMHPFASGGAGEAGILQLHPKRTDARKLRFLKDQRYREACKRRVGACQAEVVHLAASILRRAIERCGGDIARGLAAYNAGRCNANVPYPRQVTRELGKLYALANGSNTT